VYKGDRLTTLLLLPHLGLEMVWSQKHWIVTSLRCRVYQGEWDFHSIKMSPVEITLPSPAQVSNVTDSPHTIHLRIYKENFIYIPCTNNNKIKINTKLKRTIYSQSFFISYVQQTRQTKLFTFTL